MSNAIIGIKPLGFQWDTADPFLFCAFHNDDFPIGNAELEPDESLVGRNIGSDFELKDGWRMYHGDKVPGFPCHPHRGFETVTIVPKGMVDHADSLGAAGRYGDGDVQWLTTGKGVMHSEMFPMLNPKERNPLLLFQIWLNLPKANKMSEPHFKMFWHEDIPLIKRTDEAGNAITIEVIAGELEGVNALSAPPDSWAAQPENEVIMSLINLSEGAQWTLPASSAGLTRKLYFYEGAELKCEEQMIPAGNSLSLRSDAELSIKSLGSGAKLLLLQGKPINEPVVQHGPFVMNSRVEVQQAFADYQRTQFGGWPWSRNDQVHDDRGRFARYADGSEDIPA